MRMSEEKKRYPLPSCWTHRLEFLKSYKFYIDIEIENYVPNRTKPAIKSMRLFTKDGLNSYHLEQGFLFHNNFQTVFESIMYLNVTSM